MSASHEYLPATSGAQQELVLLHGWGSTREVWRSLLVLLRPWANITLIDVSGCAPRVVADSAVADSAMNLEATLAEILKCSPQSAVYVGWSLGGQLAIELARRTPHRVRAVITLCTNPCFVAANDWPGMSPADFSEFSSVAAKDITAALRRFDVLQTTGSSQARTLLRQLQSLSRESAEPSLLVGLEWLRELDQRTALKELKQPQWHLLAANDQLVPASLADSMRELLANNAHAKVKVLPGCAHLLPVDAPGELGVLIYECLEETGLLLDCNPPAAVLKKEDVAASFSRAAESYDSVAGLQCDVGERLLATLDDWDAAPKTVLDLGCGTGHFSLPLRERFPTADYIGLDLAQGMVEHSRNHCAQDCLWLVADAESLPLAANSVDLIFSSLAVQWCSRPGHLFAEFARVLRPGGRCVFSTLGPDTLRELRASWAAVDSHQHVNTFIALSALEAAASDAAGIVLSCESASLCMEYERVRDLLLELKMLGAHNMNKSRSSGLTGRMAMKGMLQAYEQWRHEGVLPATYDVIFGSLETV